jgi:multicomponent Na+:H+ antiporter subunit E
MNWFLAHIVFSLIWAALLGGYDLPTLVSGFAIGFLLLSLTLKEPSAAYRKRVRAISRFFFFYLKEILVSNLRIAGDVLRAKPAIQPGIVALNVEALSGRGAVVVANLITMTPGTLSLDISEDGRRLYVHCLYLQDPDATRTAMQRDYVDAVAAFHTTIQ